MGTRESRPAATPPAAASSSTRGAATPTGGGANGTTGPTTTASEAGAAAGAGGLGQTGGVDTAHGAPSPQPGTVRPAQPGRSAQPVTPAEPERSAPAGSSQPDHPVQPALPVQPSRPRQRRLLGLDPDSNLISLLWAAPFMVFLGFPIAAAIELGVTSSLGAPILWTTITFALVYVLTWVLNPPAPRSASLSVRLLVCMTAMFALQVLLIWSTSRAGIGGSPYLLAYISASWTLLSPRRLVLPGVAVILGFGAATVALTSAPWSDLFLALLSPLLTAAICFFARSSIDYDRRTSVEHRQALALSQERERTRISADLHDILGHTLTGITVKADLTGRLLDAGRIEDARAQLDDLTDLAREALGDVRSVVSANRLLTPTAEIDSARTLLTSAGVTLEVDQQGEPAPGASATLVAHTIREACTNALLHAEPAIVQLTMREGGVEIRNDGYSRRVSHSTSGGGTGLSGLRERLGPGDHLEWGPRGGEWVVTLELGR